MTTIPQESSKLPRPKWLERATAGTLGLIAVALLQAFGDSVFDALQSALGKRLVVQSIALLLVLLGYFAWLLLRKPRVRSLHRHRALYWAHSDKTPFCTFCYETSGKQLHLVGPTEMPDSYKDVERWECPVFYHCYISKAGEDFVLHATRGIGACVG